MALSSKVIQLALTSIDDHINNNPDINKEDYEDAYYKLEMFDTQILPAYTEDMEADEDKLVRIVIQYMTHLTEMPCTIVGKETNGNQGVIAVMYSHITKAQYENRIT